MNAKFFIREILKSDLTFKTKACPFPESFASFYKPDYMNKVHPGTTLSASSPCPQMHRHLSHSKSNYCAYNVPVTFKIAKYIPLLVLCPFPETAKFT
jgi:hypothetical protein